MPDNEIVLQDGKIVFILPENESLDAVFEKKLAAVQTGKSDCEGDGGECLHLSLTGNSLTGHIKALSNYRLIIDAESLKVVLEGERLVSQTRMGDTVVGREIVSRVEVPFQFLRRIALCTKEQPGSAPADCCESPMSVWIDDEVACSNIVNTAYEFVLSAIPQFRFFFPQTGKSLIETVYYPGKPYIKRSFRACVVAGGRICTRAFRVTQI